MRIVTWNCNGAFRRKLSGIDALNADILIVQECENPDTSDAAYRSWAGQHLWAGSNRNKGLGVFARSGQALAPLQWAAGDLQQFMAVRIDDKIDLLAVWTKPAVDSKFDYIGQFWRYLQLHKTRLQENLLICGDFNSNSIWDKRGRDWNHSRCVEELADCGFDSLYHLTRNERQGQETSPTFFLHRNTAKPYHIDYVFAHRARIANAQVRVAIGEPDEWLQFSDHMPLVIDI